MSIKLCACLLLHFVCLSTSIESFEPVLPMERTFIMIKPDGVQRGLVGKIIQRFEEKGFKLVALQYRPLFHNSVELLISQV
ncbi:hypothetical protein WDU94_006657, partial [Cyamophila willieti]